MTLPPSPWYNPLFLTANSSARAEQVNAEFAKIRQAFDNLPAPGSVGSGTSPVYVHRAYADSADGTSNFTTGAPGNRSHQGFQFNSTSPTPSAFREDYEWSRLTGNAGVNGRFRDFWFRRSLTQPPQPSTDIPPSAFQSVPPGTDPVWLTSVLRDGNGVLLGPWDAYERFSAQVSSGIYSAAFTYFKGMQVLFNGGSYVLIVAVSTGNAPSGTPQANAFWDVVAAPGIPGPPATPPSGFTSTIVLTSSTTTINLRTIADAAGYTGMSNATITFEVPTGVTIRGAAGGGLALDSGTWPSGSHTIALTFAIKSGGIVDGGGGTGGGGGSASPGDAGGNGGDAIFLREAFSGGITVEAGGTLRAGGGGGAGGRGRFNRTDDGFDLDRVSGSAGGGGGGGAPNGQGGTGGTTFSGAPASNGAAGTTAGGGAGAAGATDDFAVGDPGGNGGTFAVAGVSADSIPGGVPGAAVRKNGKTAVVTNSGTMTGAVVS